MEKYFSRLLLFKETFKRSSYEFSPTLLEMGISKIFRGLHDCYLHDKVKQGLDFDTTVDCFVIKHKDMDFDNKCLKMHYDLAFVIFTRIINKYRDGVLEYFKSNEPGNYCKLLKSTIFKNMLEGEIEELKSIPPPSEAPPPLSEAPPPSDKVVCLDCSLTREQLQELANFVNDIHLNDKPVTVDDLESFFNCRADFHIRPKNNRKAIFLLYVLCTKALIAQNWQHIVSVCALLLSSSGKKFLTQHDLSAALHDVKKKGKDPLEERIILFVEKLIAV